MTSQGPVKSLFYSLLPVVNPTKQDDIFQTPLTHPDLYQHLTPEMAPFPSVQAALKAASLLQMFLLKSLHTLLVFLPFVVQSLSSNQL